MRGGRFRGNSLLSRRDRPFRREYLDRREYVQVYRPRFRPDRRDDRFLSRRGSSYRGNSFRDSLPFPRRNRGFRDRPRYPPRNTRVRYITVPVRSTRGRRFRFEDNDKRSTRRNLLAPTGRTGRRNGNPRNVNSLL